MRLPMIWIVSMIAAVGTSGSGPAERRDVQIERAWYANGTLAEERGWRGTREEGVHRGWWPDGRPRFAYAYHDGLLQGESREWFASGALWRTQRYSAGHEAGLQRMYWEDGRVRASFVVQDGRRYGLLGAKGCVARDSATVRVSP
jgi:antitoxin component YwqK of YwqJK toxin-antitoxin module